MKAALMGLIRLYQLTLSRVLPPSCRFEPSCSHYSYEAIARYGAWRGGWLAVKRSDAPRAGRSVLPQPPMRFYPPSTHQPEARARDSVSSLARASGSYHPSRRSA